MDVQTVQFAEEYYSVRKVTLHYKQQVDTFQKQYAMQKKIHTQKRYFLLPFI